MGSIDSVFTFLITTALWDRIDYNYITSSGWEALILCLLLITTALWDRIDYNYITSFRWEALILCLLLITTDRRGPEGTGGSPQINRPGTLFK